MSNGQQLQQGRDYARRVPAFRFEAQRKRSALKAESLKAEDRGEADLKLQLLARVSKRLAC